MVCAPYSPASLDFLLAETQLGTLGLSFSLSFTPTLIPALPSPWSYSLSEARLEEDVLQHWNALQSLPPSLEISGVRGHKSQ